MMTIHMYISELELRSKIGTYSVRFASEQYMPCVQKILPIGDKYGSMALGANTPELGLQLYTFKNAEFTGIP